MTDYPKEGVPMDTKDHPDVQDNGTEYQVNTGPKTNKGGSAIDAYPNTDDNMFFASGRDEKIIRAKRQLRDGMK